MTTLIIGVLLWAAVHLMKSVTPGLREKIRTALGPGLHQGMVATLLLVAIYMMVIGWQTTTPTFVYATPPWVQSTVMALMFLSIYLFGAANGNGRIKQKIRHPMLTGMILWSGGHLLANGDIRSLILFGGLGLWAFISLFTISAREGPWVKPDSVASIGREVVSVIITAVLYAALIWSHVYFTGVPLLPS